MDAEVINKLIDTAYIYTPANAVVNIVLAFILGMIISYIYRVTHRSMSYSQSFVLTIIYVTVITSSVIMIIGNSLARAFALVGALSIIRFRTVVKDTKDTAFIFLGLAVGMATGTNNYFLSIFTTLFLCIVIFVLYKLKYGILGGSEFILRFYMDRNKNENEFLPILKRMSKSLNLLHMEPTGDDETIFLTYDISLKGEIEAKEIIREMSKIEGITEIVLVSSKSDIDY